jgi:hypothetical protein
MSVEIIQKIKTVFRTLHAGKLIEKRPVVRAAFTEFQTYQLFNTTAGGRQEPYVTEVIELIAQEQCTTRIYALLPDLQADLPHKDTSFEDLKEIYLGAVYRKEEVIKDKFSDDSAYVILWNDLLDENWPRIKGLFEEEVDEVPLPEAPPEPMMSDEEVQEFADQHGIKTLETPEELQEHFTPLTPDQQREEAAEMMEEQLEGPWVDEAQNLPAVDVYQWPEPTEKEKDVARESLGIPSAAHQQLDIAIEALTKLKELL